MCRTSRVTAALASGALILTGCATKPIADMRVHTNHPKNIFIFIDGTDNDASTQTNVRRLYEKLSSQGGKRTVTIYLPGVGDPRHPVTGKLFGKGTDHRIKSAYAELVKIYTFGDQRPPGKCEQDEGDQRETTSGPACDDRIYIFGFSRGAHAARALAGLLSYAGIPRIDTTARTPTDYYDLAKKLNDRTKKLNDADMKDYWSSWDSTKNQDPPLAAKLKDIKLDESYDKAEKSLTLKPVRIAFLGVWDTVPGSIFKHYPEGGCMESDNSTPGTRYKTNSYPTISRIAHAVAHDEKRSKYHVLHLCKPIMPASQDPALAQERIFPGAHSDVGGGYGNYALPDISLRWMVGELAHEYPSALKLSDFASQADPNGLAHWSKAGLRNILFSCKDRIFQLGDQGCEKERNGKLCVKKDHSIEKRGEVALLAIGNSNDGSLTPYPLSCRAKNELRTAVAGTPTRDSQILAEK